MSGDQVPLSVNLCKTRGDHKNDFRSLATTGNAHFNIRSAKLIFQHGIRQLIAVKTREINGAFSQPKQSESETEPAQAEGSAVAYPGPESDWNPNYPKGIRRGSEELCNIWI